MKIAYLINQYPAVSHSFIRREIAALEVEGMEIFRFSIRSAAELVDPADLEELEKTRFVLGVGISGLLSALLRTAITKPRSFLAAVLLTFKIGWQKDRGILVHLAYLAEACVMLKWIKNAQIEHIHAHFAFNPAAVAMLCHVLGDIPYSFTVHGPESIDRAVVLSLEAKIKRASFVVAISDYCRSQLYRWCDRTYWSKIQIVHCGLDQPFFDESIVPIPETNQLVCIGRLNEQKGHLILLAAAQQLALAGVDFKLVLVGDGELRSQIEAHISQFGLQNRINITGWENNEAVKQHIINSRAMVLPSFAEGLPVVIMEALALGRPVVSTYIAGIPELVDSDCGWLVPSGSATALAQAMEKALQIPTAELNQMGRVGAEKVALQHDAAIEASKLARLFQQSSKRSIITEIVVREKLETINASSKL